VSLYVLPERCSYCGAEPAAHVSQLDNYEGCRYCGIECEDGHIRFDMPKIKDGTIALSAEDATDLISRGFEIPFPKE
jgi:hypothetical protein